MKKQLLIISCLLYSVTFFGQNSGFSAKKAIKKEITSKSKTDAKKLDKADETLADAIKIYTSADKYKKQIEDLRKKQSSASSKEKKKIRKSIKKIEKKEANIRISGSKKFQQASKGYYYTYKNDFKYFRGRNQLSLEEQNEAKELEVNANTLYKKAQTKRKQSVRIPDVVGASKILADADDLEQKAIDAQLKAYGIYLKWYKSDETTEENVASNEVENNNAESNNVEESKEVTTFVDESNENNEAKEENKIDENLSDFKEPEKKPDLNENKENVTSSNTQSDIFFKIQIAASKNPLSLKKLRSIYNYTLYNNEYENGYYKYSVGKFRSYAEAEKYKGKMNLPKAFIIAYKDGRKVDVNIADPSLKKFDKNVKKEKKISAVTPSEYGVSYRIQISATRVPASQSTIKAMNPTDLDVKINKVGIWYKYTIGSFKSYSAAERYRKNNKVKGFVIQYVNGKEVK